MANRNPTDMGGAFAGVPLCSRERCPSFDGKRCGETGNEPGEVCVPEVRAMAASFASEPLCRGCGDNYNAHLAGDQGGCSGDFPEWWMRFRADRDDLARRADLLRNETTKLRRLLEEALNIGQHAISEVTHQTSCRRIAKIREEAGL